MLGGVIKRGKELVNVLVGLVNVLILNINRAQEAVPVIKVLAEVRRLSQPGDIPLLYLKNGKLRFLRWVILANKGLNIHVQPVVGFGTGLNIDIIRKIINHNIRKIPQRAFFDILGLYSKVFCDWTHYKDDSIDNFE